MKNKLLSGVLTLVIVVGGAFLLIKNYQGDNQARLFTATDRLQKQVAPTPVNPLAGPGAATLSPGTCPASGYKYVPVSWGVTFPLVNPFGLTTDSSGQALYIAEQGHHTILKLATTGPYIFQWANTWKPVDIAVDSAGDQYFIEGDPATIGTVYQIRKENSTGAIIAEWGKVGSGNGELKQPLSIAVDQSNNVYVADSLNSRIQKFSSTGVYITKWGSLGTGNGQFHNLTGVAVGPSGNVYVADQTNRIQKFTPVGTYLTQWSSGTPYSSMVALDVDSAENVYVVNSLQMVKKFSSTGTLLAQFGGQGQGSGNPPLSQGPGGITVDLAKNVYVSDWAGHSIQKFTPCVAAQLGSATNKISGKVYYDQNKNGVFNSGESSYQGVLVDLYSAGQSTPLQTATTQTGGGYMFSNVPNGTYYVALRNEAGYSLITQPLTAVGLVSGHSYVYTVTVNPSTSAQSSTNRDFGTYIFN